MSTDIDKDEVWLLRMTMISAKFHDLHVRFLKIPHGWAVIDNHILLWHAHSGSDLKDFFSISLRCNQIFQPFTSIYLSQFVVYVVCDHP